MRHSVRDPLQTDAGDRSMVYTSVFYSPPRVWIMGHAFASRVVLGGPNLLQGTPLRAEPR